MSLRCARAHRSAGRCRRPGRRARGSCGGRACGSPTAHRRAGRAPRRDGARARAGGRCGRAPRASSSRRRRGSTSSRRSCARTSARASSAASSVFSSSSDTPEQVLQAHDLAQALDLGVRVEAMAPRRARGRLGKQPDLLVVADRARRRADQRARRRRCAGSPCARGVALVRGSRPRGGSPSRAPLASDSGHRRRFRAGAVARHGEILERRGHVLGLRGDVARRLDMPGTQQADARSEQRHGRRAPTGRRACWR